VGRYLNATQVINVSTCANTAATFVGSSLCPLISPSDVHFIVNNTFAVNALCGGDPFACTVGRNVTRTQPRNQVDLSLQKTFKIAERVGLTLRGDALNAFNYQFLGAPGLNINNRNAGGISCPAGSTPATCTPAVAPNTFGETWANTGTNRAIIITGRISF
jgi:hypothetical protein